MGKMESNLTIKGQATIPVAVRRALRLNPGDRVRFELRGGVATLRRCESGVLHGFASVKAPQKPEDYERLREQVETALAEEATLETGP